jgi:hypothetical protein
VSEIAPVLAPAQPLVRRPAGGPLAARVAAVAAGSFVAGAAAIAVLQRGVPLGRRRRRRPGHVVASRSFLVEVHLLGDRR